MTCRAVWPPWPSRACQPTHHRAAPPSAVARRTACRPRRRPGRAPGDGGDAVVPATDLAADERAEAGAAADLQLPHLVARHRAHGPHLLAPGPDLAHAAQVPGPGGGDVARLLAVPGDEGVEDLDDGEQRGLRQHADAVPAPVVDQRRPEPVAGHLAAAVVAGIAVALSKDDRLPLKGIGDTIIVP